MLGNKATNDKIVTITVEKNRNCYVY